MTTLLHVVKSRIGSLFRCYVILSNRSRVAPNAQLSSTPSIFFRSYKRGTQKRSFKRKNKCHITKAGGMGCILREVRVKGKNFVLSSLGLLYACYLDKTTKNKTKQKQPITLWDGAEFQSDRKAWVPTPLFYLTSLTGQTPSSEKKLL